MAFRRINALKGAFIFEKTFFLVRANSPGGVNTVRWMSSFSYWLFYPSFLFYLFFKYPQVSAGTRGSLSLIP